MRQLRNFIAAFFAATSVYCLFPGQSVAASGQIYDMTGLLNQPHPFARPGDVYAPAQVPRPSGGAVPLPGSQYNISAPQFMAAPGTTDPMPYQPLPPLPPSQSARAGLAPEKSDRGWFYIPDPPPGSKPLFGIIAEMRLGIFDHASSLIGPGKESGTLFAPEILFTSPDFMRYIGSPMPTFGIEYNTGPRNFVQGGLTWRVGFLDNWHFNLGFGIGVHDGSNSDESKPDELKLGCRWLFHDVAALGYTFAERHVVEVQVDHYSHAGLCSEHNAGTESIGLVYGYRF